MRDGIVNSEVIYADPQECYTLVTETEVDCLAAALGSTHGLYKGKARLGFTEMKAIAEQVKVPLVLHGGTGIADEDMRRAIACGTAKINVNTEKYVRLVPTGESNFRRRHRARCERSAESHRPGTAAGTRDDCPPHGALWLRAALLTPGLRLKPPPRRCRGGGVRYQKAKQEQPSTPQKACSSETGIDDLRAISC